MTIRGLAWDDEPELLNQISLQLHNNWRTELEVVSDVGDFLARLGNEHWDFVVTDLWDENNDKGNDYTGLKIARIASKQVGLVFVLTGLPMLKASHLEFPRNVIIKTKNTGAAWIAQEIYGALKENDIGSIDHSKVFLIYGHDKKADGATGKVQHYLENTCGLQVCKGDAMTFTGNIHSDLIKLMQSCAAFVVVCTPDDQWDNGICLPRGNVLYEMGVAVGMKRGVERLLILQKWGPKPDDQAVLPSDFGGNVTIRFETRIENQLDILKQKLNSIGVAVRA